MKQYSIALVSYLLFVAGMMYGGQVIMSPLMHVHELRQLSILDHLFLVFPGLHLSLFLLYPATFSVPDGAREAVKTRALFYLYKTFTRPATGIVIFTVSFFFTITVALGQTFYGSRWMLETSWGNIALCFQLLFFLIFVLAIVVSSSCRIKPGYIMVKERKLFLPGDRGTHKFLVHWNGWTFSKKVLLAG